MALPDYNTDISLILSRVLDDIGVNEVGVLRKRKYNLINEHLGTLNSKLIQAGIRSHVFGSQTEGTTTPGLKSDIDVLLSHEDERHVIQDWKDWIRDKTNLLMIPHEVFPGYCKLQQLKSYRPLPEDRLLDEHSVMDRDGRVIYSHRGKELVVSGVERHGPAITHSHPKVFADTDYVAAFPCRSWPNGYKRWPTSQRARHWPTAEMVHYMETSGCFVVPAAHRWDDNKYESWRISTSLAERCLVFNFNITQIRCYIILKMIVKTFIEPYVPNVISSYICKTLLFHCIETTRQTFWIEPNLLQCVNYVLFHMLAAVYSMNCPNYFNESANLLLGKLDDVNKKALVFGIKTVLNSNGGFLLKIGQDNINIRVTQYMIDKNLMLSRDKNEDMYVEECAEYLYRVSKNIGASVNKIMLRLVSNHGMLFICNTVKQFSQEGPLQSKVVACISPFICSYLATSQANAHILRGEEPSQSTLLLYKYSLDSDATSSRLRFASYLYNTGQFNRTLPVLLEVEQRVTDSVTPVCGCYGKTVTRWKNSFGRGVRHSDYPTTSLSALCVTFSRAEGQCCPRELQYEMFRSTEEDIQLRDDLTDVWMDLAAVDSLPYLYFLQYMTSRHLGQSLLQSRALEKLAECTCTDVYLSHRETAYNLLGQCREYEASLDRALFCYRMSLRERPKNNAVRWHIARLFLKLFPNTDAI